MSYPQSYLKELYFNEHKLIGNTAHSISNQYIEKIKKVLQCMTIPQRFTIPLHFLFLLFEYHCQHTSFQWEYGLGIVLAAPLLKFCPSLDDFVRLLV